MNLRSIPLAILASLTAPSAAEAFFFRPYYYAPPPVIYTYAPPVFVLPPVYVPVLGCPPQTPLPTPKVTDVPKTMEKTEPRTQLPKPKELVPAAASEKVVPAKPVPSRVEPALPTAAVPDAPKPLIPSTELPKPESPKLELPKTDTPKSPNPKLELPKPDATKIELPKPEASKLELPKLNPTLPEGSERELPKPSPIVLPHEKKKDDRSDTGLPAIPNLNLPLAVPEPAVPKVDDLKPGDKKSPGSKLPAIVSESKYRPGEEPSIRVVPVEGHRVEGNRVVNFYNYTDRAIALTVDGKPKQLPAKSSLGLALPDSFIWTVGERVETTAIPADAAGLSVVIK